MNALLERDGILPSLAYVPIRACGPRCRTPSRRPRREKVAPPPTAGGGAVAVAATRCRRRRRELRARRRRRGPACGGHDGSATADGGGGGGGSGGDGGGGGPRQPRVGSGRGRVMGRGERLRPHTAWMGEADGEDAGFDEGAGLRAAAATAVRPPRPDRQAASRPARNARARNSTTPDLLRALDGMQHAAATSPTGSPRSLLDIKQTLLAQSRQVHGKGAAFSREDNDAFELLGMLYSQIEREVRRDTPAVGLLGRLQVPLLRVALQDRAFFVRQQHPARQLLNAVAESGANWLGDEDVDPQLVHSLRSAVEHVVQNFQRRPGRVRNRQPRTAGQPAATRAQGRSHRAPPRRSRARQGKTRTRQAPLRRSDRRRRCATSACRSSCARCSTRRGPTCSP